MDVVANIKESCRFAKGERDTSGVFADEQDQADPQRYRDCGFRVV